MTDEAHGPGASDRGMAVVTGASTGTGRAFAEILAGIGYDLVIAADEPVIHHVASELEAEHGRRVVGLQVDLSGAPGIEHLHEIAGAQEVPVTLGVLNAGIGMHGRVDEVELDDQLRLIDLNVRSTVHLATLLTRDMVLREEGRLLFVASIASTGQGPGQAAATAATAFVHSFAEAFGEELRGTGVSVASLLPGPGDSAHDVARQGVEALLDGRDDATYADATYGDNDQKNEKETR